MGSKAGTAALPTEQQKAQRQNLSFFVPDFAEVKKTSNQIKVPRQTAQVTQ